MFAKALGNETGRPTLVLDVGALYGSLVGATEANVRQALRVADAMAPCILYTDEVEKGLSGVGGQGDSGVSTRLFGTLLTWLAEHETDVFFIATANDISRLPPEFTRAERLDGTFFLDLPTSTEKDLIWQMYRTQFGIPESQVRPEDTSWTGAEVKACCRLAALLDVPLTQAAHHVVPVAVTAAEAVEKLRTWASGRCLNAAAPGIYHRDGEQPARPGRRVQRGVEQQLTLRCFNFGVGSVLHAVEHRSCPGSLISMVASGGDMTMSSSPLRRAGPRDLLYFQTPADAGWTVD